MADFTFIAHEPGSVAFKRAVRSRAARAVLPPSRSASQSAADAVSIIPRPSEEPSLRQTRLHRPADTCADASGGVVTRTSSQSGEPSAASQSKRIPSQEPVSNIPMEPTHPVLAHQPLFSAEFSPLLTEFYLKHMAVDIPDLDQDRPGSLRSSWFPFAILHDGLLEIIFLLSGSCYLNSDESLQSQHDKLRGRLVSLKQGGLANIRRLITDSAAKDSDQAIAAVTKMASFEAMYGTRDEFNIHMGALREMVKMRGGLANLGLNGLLERMVCWVDYNSACLLDAQMYFPEANALPKPVAFDPVAFIGGPR